MQTQTIATALAVLDQFLRFHELTAADLEPKLRRRYRGRRGVDPASTARVACDRANRSQPGESWIRMAILRRGPAGAASSSHRHGRRAASFRLDLAYPEHRDLHRVRRRYGSTQLPSNARNDEARRRVAPASRMDGHRGHQGRPRPRGASRDGLGEIRDALGDSHTDAWRCSRNHAGVSRNHAWRLAQPRLASRPLGARG